MSATDKTGAEAHVSQADMYKLLIKAGATPQEATTLAAVGMAESGGYPNRFNNTDPHGGSFGLWQINGANNSDHRYLADPQNNARAAVKILRSQGIKAWGAYTNGSYQQFLGAPPAPVGAQSASAPATSGGGVAKSILDYASSLIGTPYKWGGNTPQTGLDCSGLVKLAYSKYGVDLPRTAAQQEQAGTRIDASKAQPGDLVSFDENAKDANGLGADHIGIYLGNGQMLVSPHTGSSVQVQAVSGINAQARFTRVLPNNAATWSGIPATSSGTYAYSSTGATPEIASMSGSGALPANATPAQVKAAVASQFGYLSAFLDDPEVGPILMKAAKEGWDMPTLQGALFKTNFWQKHGANQRQFDAQTKLDPATQKAQIASVAADLQAQARKTGLTLTPAQYGQIATDSLKFGWSPQQTTNALLGEGKLDYSGKQGPSQIAAVMDGLRGTAKSYFVPVSDQALSGWAKQVVSGQISQGDFDAYVKTQAKSLFPALSTAIDRGITVDKYVDPYRQLAAQTLEISPDTIDFTNPKFNKALFQKDPKTGDNTSMSLSDFGTYLRGLPEYAKTAKANDDVAQFGTQLLNTFGKIA